MSSVAGSTLAAAITPTAQPLSFVLLGATGRTGLPFMQQALARGHRITAFTRSAQKIPDDLAANVNLTVVEVDLNETQRLSDAIIKAKPDVVYTMLASDPKPHKAMSTGNRAAHYALRLLRERSASAVDGAAGSVSARTKPTPFIAIAGWGAGPTRPFIHRWYERAFLFLAVNTFYAPMLKDFELMLMELESPIADGIIQPILLMPPLLTNGERTATYQFGDALAEEMKAEMHMFDSVSRASMANLALTLGEKAMAGDRIPQWVAIRQP